MESLKKTKVVLWILIIILIAIYVFVYTSNPLQKEFNLGLVGLIFSTIYCLFWILFRSNRLKKEIALTASFIVLIILYLFL